MKPLTIIEKQMIGSWCLAAIFSELIGIGICETFARIAPEQVSDFIKLIILVLALAAGTYLWILYAKKRFGKNDVETFISNFSIKKG